MMKSKRIVWLKENWFRILFWLWIIFLLDLSYEAVFVIPLEKTSWGFQNWAMVDVMLMVLASILLLAFIEMRDVKSRLKKLEEKK